MTNKLPALSEEQLKPRQQVAFVPIGAKGLGDSNTRFGFITSIAPSGLSVYCRFWDPQGLKSFQEGGNVQIIQMLKGSVASEGRVSALLHPYVSVDQEVVNYTYRAIYVDSLRIASKFMEFCAKVLEVEVTPSTAAGVRGEPKAVTYQDLPNMYRLSFTPFGGWECASLTGQGYWKSPHYKKFLEELIRHVGEAPSDNDFLLLLRRLRFEYDQELIDIFHHVFKFEPPGG